MGNHLAVDVGSSGTKVLLLRLTEKGYETEQIMRFQTPRTVLNGHWHINTYLIFQNICDAIRELGQRGGVIDSLGVDTWTSDYGIINSAGEQIGLPSFYRDSQFDAAWELVEQKISYEELYRLTTQRKMRESTLCQLVYTTKQRPALLQEGDRLLFLGDLIMYYFTGRACSEISAASYSQMFDMRAMKWQPAVFERFALPRSLQTELVEAGDTLGAASAQLAAAPGVKPFRIIAPATHDTSSAVAAVPARSGENWAFIATGSWFLIGVELDAPADCGRSMRYSCSNTGLAFGKTMLKRNVTAMWLLQECRRCWQARGISITFSQIAEMAAEAEPFYAMLNPEDAAFVHPQDMPGAISAWLEAHGQRTIQPDDIGRIARTIYESVALASAYSLRAIEYVSNTKKDVVYAVGGASRVALLNQMLANATGKPVLTGPEEASGIGNGLLQAYGAGEISSAEELRARVRAENQEKRYDPADGPLWAERLAAFCTLCGRELPEEVEE